MPGPPERPSTRLLAGLVAAGVLWRAVICARTPVPSEDGVNKLWMAERFAAGDFAAPAHEVFPPLLPLLAAPGIALGLPPFLSAQVVLVLASALAVIPIARASERAAPGSGAAAAWLVAFAHMPVRHAAEVHDGALFVPLAALALAAGLAGHSLALGLWAGLAFWVRPEAVLLVLGFTLAAPRRHLRAWLPLVAAVVALALWRALAGAGADPLPRLAFNWERTVLAAGDPAAALARFGSHLVRLPALWLEAFAVIGVLAVWGALQTRRPAWRPLGWMLALGAALVAAFLPRRRFLVPWLPAAAPFAAAGVGALPPRARVPALVLAVAAGLLLALRTTDPDRAAERHVGVHLAERLAPAETVAGNMTRVVWFAGRRPLPPRRWSAEDLIEAARAPAVRFVVLQRDRPTTGRVVAALRGSFAPLPLPPPLAEDAAERGIVVLRRLP